MLVSTLHFVSFSFHSCFIMIADNRDVFMNVVREDGEGEGFPLSVFDYGVSIGEARGFGNGGGGVESGDGGHGFEASPSEVIIDRKLGENDLEIFEVEVATQQKQLFLQLELNQKFWST